jgi:aminoglycoside phosphotransferase
MAVVPDAEERTSYGMAAPRYRWADLPVASWSLTWNYQGDWQGLFFDTYGVEPDRERIDYYRLLWELSP